LACVILGIFLTAEGLIDWYRKTLYIRTMLVSICLL